MSGSLFPPPWTVGFQRLTGIVNSTTGETVPVDIEIHAEDLDWLLELHQQSFALNWELHLAEIGSDE